MERSVDMKIMEKMKRVSFCFFNRIARRFGLCIIPTSEIDRMESDAASHCTYMKREGLALRDKGYFNGLSDYASKTASRLRELYVPTKEA